MRLGQNPAKSIAQVPQPAPVTVAIVTYIPFLSGYYAESLEVLKVCLESLVQNTPQPFDLLVFDNASCPEVRSYLQNEHDAGRIQYLILAGQNFGKGGAWNFIFQGAPGEIIAYADSDIQFSPGWLESSLEILQAFPKAGMVSAHPLRTPAALYSSTLAWAQLASQAGLASQSAPASQAGQAGHTEQAGHNSQNEHTPRVGQSDPFDPDDEVQIEQGSFIPWEVYREHVLSLGTSEEQAREWYESRQDTRLTRQGVQALIGAAHFQFTVRKSIIQAFLPFKMDRPMGQVRTLDDQMNAAGWLRLATCEPLVRHLGNTLPVEPKTGQQLRTDHRRLWDTPVIRRVLLRVYDVIFRLYYGR
ncbi:MAG TPA: glycosyltransferase family A protein [Anaerolineales bacterium]|nr:glycosyltransferase family A protein [Anaerolineales bacterium]